MSKDAFDTLDIAGQADARRQAEERARLREKIATEDLKWVMQNRRGRRFVHGILERAGVWRSSFNTNALTMAFQEGQRNEGLALLARVVEHCPELHTQMIKEHSEDE